jgi:hypothetical protein
MTPPTKEEIIAVLTDAAEALEFAVMQDGYNGCVTDVSAKGVRDCILRLSAEPAPVGSNVCVHDGCPCFVGGGTDDAHFRCGTSACKPSPVGDDVKARIKHMVAQFLSWRLPAAFRPDNGISFESVGNAGTVHAYDRSPTGTNLLDAAQAETMVRHMLDGLPTSPPEGIVMVRRELTDEQTDAMDEAFHIELQKQTKDSQRLYGTTAYASGPFIELFHRAMIAATTQEKSE